MAGTNGRLQILDDRGRPLGIDDPAAVDPGMAEPHIFSFQSLLRGGLNSYFRLTFDEAMRHSQENALAMRYDEHIGACLRERIRGVTSSRWHLEADNPKDPAQKAVAEGLTRIIRSVPYLRRLRRYLGWRLWYGRYGVQVQWEWREMELPMPGADFLGGDPVTQKIRALTVKRHLPVNGDKIGYDWSHVPLIRVNGSYHHRFQIDPDDVVIDNLGFSLRLRENRWRERFIIGQHDPTDEDFNESDKADAVHGVGIRSWLYWSWWMKSEYMTSTVDALERYGLGFIVIKYPTGNDQAKQQADTLAKTFSRRTVVKMPYDPSDKGSGEPVQVVEAPMSGMQLLMELQKLCEAREERFIIAQTLSSDHTGSGGLGGSGAADFQMDTKHQLLSDDADEEGECLTGSETEPGLVSILMRHTYPQFYGQFPTPRWTSDLDDPNHKDKLDAAKVYVEMGGEVLAEEVRGLIGLSKPQEGDETLGGKEALAQQQQADAGKGGPGGGMPPTPPSQAHPPGWPHWPGHKDPHEKKPGAPGQPAEDDNALPFASEDEPERYGDVSGEPRDAGGRWTVEGGAGHEALIGDVQHAHTHARYGTHGIAGDAATTQVHLKELENRLATAPKQLLDGLREKVGISRTGSNVEVAHMIAHKILSKANDASRVNWSSDEDIVGLELAGKVRRLMAGRGGDPEEVRAALAKAKKGEIKSALHNSYLGQRSAKPDEARAILLKAIEGGPSQHGRGDDPERYGDQPRDEGGKFARVAAHKAARSHANKVMGLWVQRAPFDHDHPAHKEIAPAVNDAVLGWDSASPRETRWRLAGLGTLRDRLKQHASGDHPERAKAVLEAMLPHVEAAHAALAPHDPGPGVEDWDTAPGTAYGSDGRPELYDDQPRAADGRWVSEGDWDAHAAGKARGILSRAARLPAKAVAYAKSKAAAMYAKLEEKYGARWAKAVVATAVLTLPTPVTTLSVLAMTGLAHLCTGGGKKREDEAEHYERGAEAFAELFPPFIRAARQRGLATPGTAAIAKALLDMVEHYPDLRRLVSGSDLALLRSIAQHHEGRGSP